MNNFSAYHFCASILDTYQSGIFVTDTPPHCDDFPQELLERVKTCFSPEASWSALVIHSLTRLS
jgi:hypothetical protein